MVLLLPLLHLLPVLLGSADAGALRYDQTQTGDTNIHLQIKNVEVLALLDDIAPGEVNSIEYDYDYNDFTEKPHKPHNGSSSTTHPLLVPPPAPVEAVPAPAAAAASNTTAVEGASASASEAPLLGPTTPPPPPAAAPEALAAAPDTQAPKKTRRCGAGFYRDTLGRCRRIRRPHLQMLVNLGRRKPAESAT